MFPVCSSALSSCSAVQISTFCPLLGLLGSGAELTTTYPSGSSRWPTTVTQCSDAGSPGVHWIITPTALPEPSRPSSVA